MAWFQEATTLLDPLPPQRLTLRRGDRLPAFAARIEDQDGVVVNLTASRVFMTLRPLAANVAQPANLVRLELTLESAVGGVVSYDWQYNQTSGAPASDYETIIEVEYDNGTRIAAPSASCGVVVAIRPSAASGYFEVDGNGVLVPDGAGGFTVAS